jgi:hypothetical protein
MIAFMMLRIGKESKVPCNVRLILLCFIPFTVDVLSSNKCMLPKALQAEDKIFVGISPALGKRPHLFTLDKAIWELAGGLRKEEFFHFLIIRLFDRLHLTKPLFWPFVFSSIMQLMNPSVAC